MSVRARTTLLTIVLSSSFALSAQTAQAAPSPPLTTPVVVGPIDVQEGPIVVPAGSWILFRFDWGWASDGALTDPSNYAEEFFDGGYTFALEVDGRSLSYATSTYELADVCFPRASDSVIVCQDATFARFERLHHPLAVRDHTVTFRLTSLKDFPDDGWGYAVSTGDVFEFTGTLTVAS